MTWKQIASVKIWRDTTFILSFLRSPGDKIIERGQHLSFFSEEVSETKGHLGLMGYDVCLSLKKFNVRKLDFMICSAG